MDSMQAQLDDAADARLERRWWFWVKLIIWSLLGLVFVARFGTVTGLY